MDTLKLPDISSNSYARTTYVLNDKQYTFIFNWCFGICFISIYFIQDNQKVYLLENRPLNVDTDLFMRIKDDTLITGSLYLRAKNSITELTAENFSTYFEMEYEDE